MPLTSQSGPQGLSRSATGLAAAALTVAMVTLLVVPRSAPLVLLLAALPALAWSRPREIAADDLGRAPLVVVLAMASYFLINSLWAVHRIGALGSAALAAAIIVATWLAQRGLSRAPDALVLAMARAAAIAVPVAVVYLGLEEATQHRIKTAVFNWLPALRPSTKHIDLEGDIVSRIEVYLSNRSIGTMVLVLWPVLLTIGWRRVWPAVAAGVLLVLAGAVAVLSSHETSIIALFLSAKIAVLALRWRRIAYGLVAIGWITATLLVVPIVSHPAIRSLHAAEWLPKSARHRIVLWEYTAEQVARSPLLGIGIGSGKILDERRQRTEPPPGYRFERRAGAHAHNVYLQTWYELGAVGAVLLCAAGLSLLLAMARLPAGVQPTALATFVAAACLAAFSWGMWQAWFMAAFGVAAFLLMLAAEAHRRRAGIGAAADVGREAAAPAARASAIGQSHRN